MKPAPGFEAKEPFAVFQGRVSTSEPPHLVIVTCAKLGNDGTK